MEYLSSEQKIVELDRRSHIIMVATELFCSKGYSGTRMSDIANAIGVTKPIVYRYFNSKEALFETWLDEVLIEGRDKFQNLIERKDISILELTKEILVSAKNSISNPLYLSPWRIALLEADSFPNIANMVCKKFKDPLFDSIIKMFENGIKNGEVRGDETPQTLAMLFTSPIASSAVLVSTFGSELYSIDEIDRLFKAHYSSFWEVWKN